MPQPDRTRAVCRFLSDSRRCGQEKSSSQLAWLRAAPQPLHGFAAELRRDFLMAGIDAIGSRSDFVPCTGVWNSLVHHVGSSRRCSVKAHGEAVIMRRRAALASALRTAATFPLWLRLNPSTPALSTPRKDRACIDACCSEQWHQLGWPCGVEGGGPCLRFPHSSAAV